MIYPRLHLDKETRSTRELSAKSKQSTGLYRYAACPTTSVWMFSYRFEYAPGVYGPTKRWWRDEAFPEEVFNHVALGLPVLGHNVAFERTMWNVVLPRQLGIDLPKMIIEQTDCTMARARVLGLPGDLERAAEVVDAPVKKDAKGKATMLKMAKPRSIEFSSERAGREFYAGGRVVIDRDELGWSRFGIGLGTGHAGDMKIVWWYDETLRRELSEYCDDDVGAECGIDRVVLALSDSERATWELDQRINERGIMVDVPLIRRVISLVDMAMTKANRRIWTLTDGKVKKCTEHAKVKTWLNDRGITCDSVAKDKTETLVALSRTNGDQIAREVIEVHNAHARAATGKFHRALVQMLDDHRLYGQFVYHMANATGRWAGNGVQLQNLVRIDEERDLPTIRSIIDIILTFEPDAAFEMVGVL